MVREALAKIGGSIPEGRNISLDTGSRNRT
jgi:hypothetical protein